MCTLPQLKVVVQMSSVSFQVVPKTARSGRPDPRSGAALRGVRLDGLRRRRGHGQGPAERQHPRRPDRRHGRRLRRNLREEVGPKVSRSFDEKSS